MASPGTDVAMPWTPPSDEALDERELALRRRRRPGPVDLELDAQASAAACVAPSMICWMNGLPRTW